MKLNSRALVASVGFVVAGLVLSGCSGAASNDAGSGDAAAESITIKIATVQPTDSVDVTTLKEIAEAVAEKSDGSINLEIFDNGQIGTTADTAAQAASGEDIITFIDAGTASSLGNPDMSILGGPFLFEDAAQASTFAKSDMFADMATELAANGNLQILAMNWLDGPRHVWGNKAYPEPTDLDGVKMRTPPIDTWDRTFKPLGAVTTTIENTEVYSALEQGVVEAAEGPINGTYAQKWFEVAPELTLTGHFRTFLGFAIGTTTFDKLSAEQQQILMEEFTAGGDRATERYVEVEGENLATMEAAGVTVHEANIKAYQDATAGFYSEYGDLLEKVRAAGK